MYANQMTTYETECIARWLEKDAAATNMVNDMACECFEQAQADDSLSKREIAISSLAQRLERYVESRNPLRYGRSCPYGELLDASLAVVNWPELAASRLEIFPERHNAPG